MSLLEVKNIKKSYGQKVLFEDISFAIAEGQKVGLVARNGAGKTSLLDIIAGIDAPDSGTVLVHKGFKVTYLRQHHHFKEGFSVLDTLLTGQSEVFELVRQYENLLLLVENDPSPQNIKKLNDATVMMDSLQAWDHETRLKQLVTFLQVGSLDAKVETLSGGQQKRLALAAVLFEEPDLLLLDEPTNHLDLQMVEWLEGYLSKFKITMVIVTHDRYLLDAVCNEIIELEMGEVFSYKGNYSYYITKKHERLELEARMTERARNLLRKETEWMRRTPQARTTKSKARIDSFYQLEERAKISREATAGKISMEMTHLGRKILEVDNITKSFDGKPVVNNFSYVFKRGERVGIIGPNGSGKSTFLNIITNQIRPDAGKVTAGETLNFGYFKQDGIKVEDSKKVIEAITDIAESIKLGNDRCFSASQFLHYFGFERHAQRDLVAKLSGGEKRRLYLMTILMRNPNFLILDEPTNDLDIHTLNLLEEFLEGFDGCLIIVSHDRYFVDRLVDHLFVFGPIGQIKDYPGNYTQYRLSQPKKSSITQNHDVVDPLKDTRVARQKSGLTFKEQKELAQLEAEIEKLELKKSELMEKMNSGTLQGNEIVNASLGFEELEKELEIKTDRWLELSEKA